MPFKSESICLLTHPQYLHLFTLTWAFLRKKMIRGKVSLSQKETKSYKNLYSMLKNLGEGWESNYNASFAYRPLRNYPTQPYGGREDFDSTDGVWPRFTAGKEANIIFWVKLCGTIQCIVWLLFLPGKKKKVTYQTFAIKTILNISDRTVKSCSYFSLPALIWMQLILNQGWSCDFLWLIECIESNTINTGPKLKMSGASTSLKRSQLQLPRDHHVVKTNTTSRNNSTY